MRMDYNYLLDIINFVKETKSVEKSVKIRKVLSNLFIDLIIPMLLKMQQFA